jgi:branched-chain amino acid transport system substrate-binding protein
LAATEVTERAKLPMLTLSYSDLITSRGFKYVFQTSATAAAQAEMALPVVMKLAESSGVRPKTVAILTDNTGSSVASVKPMRERLLKDMGLTLVMDETFTPPLADATPLVQKVRTARPDLLFALPTAVSDAKTQRVRFGSGQIADHRFWHRHGRTRHAQNHGRQPARGADAGGRQLGCQRP